MDEAEGERRYFAGIRRVQEISSVSAVNDALDEGWELLAIRERVKISQDRPGRALNVSSLVYVLGWPKPIIAAPAEEQRATREIRPDRPVPSNNRPIGWLTRKLIPSVIRKHTNATIELLEAGGLVNAIRISAPSDEIDEIVNDVTSSVEWAFETVLSDGSRHQEKLN